MQLKGELSGCTAAVIAPHSVQCNGARDSLRSIFSSVTVHPTIGTYLPLVTVLTRLCGRTHNSLHGIFSRATAHATVGMYLPIDNMFTV